MELSILQWIFQGIPECLALASLTIVMAGRRLEPKRIFLIGLLSSVVAYLVRLLPLSFGVHFIILVIVLAFLINMLYKINLSRSLLTALISSIILAAAEVVFVTMMYLILGITYEEARGTLLLWIIAGWPHIIFLFLLAVVIERWGKCRRARREELHV